MAQYASNYRSIGASRGLAVPVVSTIGTLIVFAIAPNKVVADRGTGKHSPYTITFLCWIGEPNLKVGEVFRCISQNVVNTTNGQQVPLENSSLIGGGIYRTARSPIEVVTGAHHRRHDLHVRCQ